MIPYGIYGKANNLGLIKAQLEAMSPGEMRQFVQRQALLMQGQIRCLFPIRPEVSRELVVEAVAYTYNARCGRA